MFLTIFFSFIVVSHLTIKINHYFHKKLNKSEEIETFIA